MGTIVSAKVSDEVSYGSRVHSIELELGYRGIEIFLLQTC